MFAVAIELQRRASRQPGGRLQRRTRPRQCRAVAGEGHRDHVTVHAALRAGAHTEHDLAPAQTSGHGVRNLLSGPLPIGRRAEVDHLLGRNAGLELLAESLELLRQLKPDAPAEDVRQALMRTASHPDAPDSETGYGLVDAAAAAIRLGVPLTAGLVRDGRARFFHPDDGSPISLVWDPARGRPPLELVDVRGRRVPVAVSQAGPILTLRPLQRLPGGVYIAHIP